MLAILIATAGLAVWAITATIVVVARDGYRAVPTSTLAASDRRDIS